MKSCRSAITLSLSAAHTPIEPAATIASVVQIASSLTEVSISVDDFIFPSPSRIAVWGRVKWPARRRNDGLAVSPLRDRRFDMRLEPRALAEPVVPGAQIVERRPLDRKGEPAVDLGAEHDLGEAQLGAGEVGSVLDLVIDDHPGRQGAPPRRFDRGGVARLGLGAH